MWGTCGAEQPVESGLWTLTLLFAAKLCYLLTSFFGQSKWLLGSQSPPQGCGVMATVSPFNPEDEGDCTGLVATSVHASHSGDFEDAPLRNKSLLPGKCMARYL